MPLYRIASEEFGRADEAAPRTCWKPWKPRMSRECMTRSHALGARMPSKVVERRRFATALIGVTPEIMQQGMRRITSW